MINASPRMCWLFFGGRMTMMGGSDDERAERASELSCELTVHAIIVGAVGAADVQKWDNTKYGAYLDDSCSRTFSHCVRGVIAESTAGGEV
jgi:hypothetical protein